MSLPRIASTANAAFPNIETAASLIPCEHTRYCVQFLVAGMQSSQRDHGSVMGVLTEMAGDIKDIKEQNAGSSRIWPVPPGVIHACSQSVTPLTSGSELRTSSSSSSGSDRKRSRKVALSDHEVWVMCPFCPKRHWNETSHVQHVQRSVQR
jgi:hypothetical protein